MIVLATVAHATALAAIHAVGFPPREAWGEDAIGLQLALPGAFGLIDDRGGMLLGRVAADEAEVLTLAVAPAVRRNGGIVVDYQRIPAEDVVAAIDAIETTA